MPLPFIIGAAAAIAGAAGAGSAIHGGVEMKKANDTMKAAKRKQEDAVAMFEKENSEIAALMDSIGKLESEIFSSFSTFADLIEKIQERPRFGEYKRENVELFEYETEEIRELFVGAEVLLGAAAGATLGVGLLVGGTIFNVTGSKLLDKAGEAYNQANRTEKEVYDIVDCFEQLKSVASRYKIALSEVKIQYGSRLAKLNRIINASKKVDWVEFTDREKQMTMNTVLLVGLLNKTIKTRHGVGLRK